MTETFKRALIVHLRRVYYYGHLLPLRGKKRHYRCAECKRWFGQYTYRSGLPNRVYVSPGTTVKLAVKGVSYLVCPQCCTDTYDASHRRQQVPSTSYWALELEHIDALYHFEAVEEFAR